MPAEILPRLELLTQNLCDTLLNIQTANGFQTTIRRVTRARLDGVDPQTLESVVGDNLVSVFEQDQEDAEESPLQTSDYWQPYAIVCFVNEPKASLYAPRKRLQLMRADIKKALLVDPTRNGYAHDSVIGPMQWMPEPEQFGWMDGCVVPVRCRYREDYYDPYFARGSAAHLLSVRRDPNASSFVLARFDIAVTAVAAQGWMDVNEGGAHEGASIDSQVDSFTVRYGSYDPVSVGQRWTFVDPSGLTFDGGATVVAPSTGLVTA
jgi:hypothetical protein